MLLFRNSLLKISQQQLFFFSIQKGEPLLRKLHTEEAGSICRESSNHGRPESSQQRSSTFLPHQSSINIHEAFVGTLRGSLIPRFQDIRRDRHALYAQTESCRQEIFGSHRNKSPTHNRRYWYLYCTLLTQHAIPANPPATTTAKGESCDGSSIPCALIISFLTNS